MGIRSGLLVGPYRLDAPLGQGGMGVVFSAVDTKLQRPVAVKFLSRELSDDARHRFEREARLASSLNHPHILTVHDAGEFEGQRYLVTEFVDGGTLDEWARTETRTWRQIVDLLIGVADGLATAHQAGILHRDVKSQNILVGKSGYAKLADFGLAKLGLESREGPGIETVAATRDGLVVGTVAYMSPEQASGKPLDARSDIFSFGVVLYELLAGRRPFVGVSDLEVLQMIIHGTAPPLGPTIPSGLRMAVEKALEKDPADRYQTMRELVVDLRRVARRQTEDSSQLAVRTPRGRLGWRWAALGASVIALVAVAAFAGRWSARVGVALPSPPTHMRFQRITDFVGMEEMPAISPDGKTVAFVAPVNGRRQIWIRLLAGGAPVAITRDDVDHLFPRWSPDSSAIMYFTNAAKEGDAGTLWEVAALGGASRRLASSTGGADISHDGRRIATFQMVDGKYVLAILPRDGSTAGSTIPLPPNVREYDAPRWSPDDRSIAFSARGTAFDSRIFLVDATGGEPAVVTRADDLQGVAWLPDGSGLVYASSTGSTLFYPPIFNLRSIARDGRSERHLTVGDVSYVQPDIAQTGKLFASRVRMQSDIWGFPVSGTPSDNVKNGIRITQQTGHVQTPSPSPDGKEIAYLSDSGGHGNVWVAKTDGSGVRQITFENDPAVIIGIPVWSPAGDRIVLVRTASPGNQFLRLINPDASGVREIASGVGPYWAADGQSIYYQSGPIDASCIYHVSLEGAPSVRVRCVASNAVVSSDGKTLYYSPHLMAHNEILKASPPDAPGVPVTRYARSRIPLWPHHYVLSPDDRWLTMPLMDGGTTNIWAMPTNGGPYRQLTDFGRRSILIARQVAWARDGKTIYAAVVERDADIVLLDGIGR